MKCRVASRKPHPSTCVPLRRLRRPNGRHRRNRSRRDARSPGIRPFRRTEGGLVGLPVLQRRYTKNKEQGDTKKSMATVHMKDTEGAEVKRVLPVQWQEAVPFALKLKERWHIAPAVPERVRYLELQDCLLQLDGDEEWGAHAIEGPHGRTVVESKVTILHAFGADTEQDE